MAVRLKRDLDPDVVRANVARVRERIDAAARVAGRKGDEVELLAAVKYVPAEELGTLARAGLTLLGENRAQDLLAKQEAHPSGFTWDFIGALQSRKVRQIAGRVRLIHSVASESALAQLGAHGQRQPVLIEVNVAGEQGKAGVAAQDLPAFLERCPVPVLGLMTMPPFASDPEQSRPHFAALRELADGHGLKVLSMGTSQDYEAAVEEGATIVRLGSTLFDPPQ